MINETNLKNSRDLSKGVIVVLSGGPVDIMNPADVLQSMDQLIQDVNADPFVRANTGGKGLTFKLLPNWNFHIHQSEWPTICNLLKVQNASPLILVGHSNGGAAVIDIARCLEASGQAVDLAITADSVLTLNDNGDPNKVPTNIKINLNPYIIPTALWWLLPFPYGQPSTRQSDGSLDGILNIGLPFLEGGALAHHDAFFDLAGGAPVAGGGHTYPDMMLDAILASLRGAGADEIFQLAQKDLQILANEIRIPIDLARTGLQTTLTPAGAAPATDSRRLSESRTNALRQTMREMERQRLAAFPAAYS